MGPVQRHLVSGVEDFLGSIAQPVSMRTIRVAVDAQSATFGASPQLLS